MVALGDGLDEEGLRRLSPVVEQRNLVENWTDEGRPHGVQRSGNRREAAESLLVQAVPPTPP